MINAGCLPGMIFSFTNDCRYLQLSATLRSRGTFIILMMAFIFQLPVSCMRNFNTRPTYKLILLKSLHFDTAP